MGNDRSLTAGRKRLGWFVLLAGAAALSALLVNRWRKLGFDWEHFAAVLLQVDWLWVAAAAGCALLTYLGRALRWQILLRPVKSHASLWRLTSATAIGFTAVVLFGRAGELVRPYLIAVKERVPFTSQVAAWLLERIYDVLTALLFFGIALSRVRASGVAFGAKLTWILRVGGYAAGFVGLVCLAILVVFGRYSSTMKTRLLEALGFLPESSFRRVEALVSAFAQGVESTRERGFVYLVSFYSLVEWGLIISGNYCLFRAFPPTARFSLTDVVIFVGFVAFGSVIQVPGVGGGLQVAAVVVLTEMYGLSLETASGVALCLWVTTFVVIVPFGLLLGFREGLNWRKLKHIEGEESIL